jgi:perosamine synthetase
LIQLGKPQIGLSEKISVWRQLSSGHLAQGSKVLEFERKFSKLSGTDHVIAVNSGTSALHIGNLSLGLGPGDEVILPSFTFAASANSVALTGAKPVFCDVDPDFFTLDPTKVRALITARTKAIMAVHLYGQMSDMEALKELASEFDLLLIEDAAQAHGAAQNGRPAGSWGNFAAFSFYPTKNMTTGEGGAITTNSVDLNRMSRLLRNQGMIERYKNEVVGLNNRMTEISAVIGIMQLRKLKKFTSLRIRNAEILTDLLGDVKGIQLPKIRKNSIHVFHQYTILVDSERDKFSVELEKLGVKSAVYYPEAVHKLPAYGEDINLPVTESLNARCLSIPVHSALKKKEVYKVAKAIRKVLGQ